MSDDDDRQGFWYWMTLMNPEYYFIAKLLGGDAEKKADAAFEDLAPMVLVVIVLIGIGLAVFTVGRMFNVW